MLKKLLSTAASRVLVAIINLVTIWIIARYIGAAAVGTVSLIILGISVIQMITSVFAGSSIVFQYSRHPLSSLLIMAWSWIVVAGVIIWLVLSSLSLIPIEFSFDVLFLSFIAGVFSLNQNVLLGKEKISTYNLFAILQVLVILVTFSFLVLVMKRHDVNAYVTAQYAGFGIVALLGTLTVMPPLKSFKLPPIHVVKEAAQFGGYLQTASFMQLFNYRLSYYIIERFFDRATLGVFSLGVQIAESIWIIAKSMAVIQYSRISGSRDNALPVKLTMDFFKFTAVITLILILIIIVLPAEFFIFIFQGDFINISSVILSLSPGILAVALSLILSHYFSGTGQPQHNTISSGLGLIITVLCGFTLIPLWSLPGAGITASIAYTCSLIYQLVVFKRKASLKWNSFLLNREDVDVFRKELKTIRP